ncbi:MAG: hypothetical protein A2W95_16940 [Bacteroidetes bacterium GWA2_40_14]|nr:MAG: hypothetical protein A2W95_16940 [Bacteroidetes bacterium GWA2_40_14]
MKLIKYIVIASTVFIYSCRDEDKLNLNIDDIPKGVYVTFEASSTNISSDDLENTSISGIFKAPANNVKQHEIYVKRIYNSGADESAYLFLESITKFPTEWSVDATALSNLFDVEVEELFGNFFEFNCFALGFNNDTASYNNLDDDLKTSPEQLQGFNFTGAIVCPSDPSIIIGTYQSVCSGNFPDFGDFSDLTHTVTIFETETDGVYEISDFSFGAYNNFYGEWYGGGDLPGTINDVCGVFFISNTLDPWGEVVSGNFTFNSDNTITVTGGTTYGEVWTAILTKTN